MKLNANITGHQWPQQEVLSVHLVERVEGLEFAAVYEELRC